MFHCNIRSIRNKVNLLDLFLTNQNCDILTLNEHWLFEEESTLYVPYGYYVGNICVRNNASSRGGGSVIFVKKGIEAKAIDVRHFYQDNVFEITAILIPKFNLIISTLYRTPDSNVHCFLNVYESYLLYLSRKYPSSHYVISADFNIDILQRSPEKESFLNLLRSFDIYWLNEEPTRGDKCLDNIVTNIEKTLVNCHVIEPHLSDHAGVSVQFLRFINENKSNNVSTKFIRDLTPQTIIKFKRELSHVDWHLEKFDDVNLAFDHFNFKLTSLFNECCRIKEIKVSS